MTDKSIESNCSRRAEFTQKSVKYLGTRLVGIIIYFLLLAFLVEQFSIRPLYATMITFIIVFLYNYAIGYFWIFYSTKKHHLTFSKFLITAALAFHLNAGIIYLSVDVFGIWYIWAQAIATLIVPPFNFIMDNYWSFS